MRDASSLFTMVLGGISIAYVTLMIAGTLLWGMNWLAWAGCILIVCHTTDIFYDAYTGRAFRSLPDDPV